MLASAMPLYLHLGTMILRAAWPTCDMPQTLVRSLLQSHHYQSSLTELCSALWLTCSSCVCITFSMEARATCTCYDLCCPAKAKPHGRRQPKGELDQLIALMDLRKATICFYVVICQAFIVAYRPYKESGRAE